MGWMNAGRVPFDPYGMTVVRFISLMDYGDGKRPDNVSPERWAGMMMWYAIRFRDKDWECE